MCIRDRLYDGRWIDKSTREHYHKIRIIGNKAAHEDNNSAADATLALTLLSQEVYAFSDYKTEYRNTRTIYVPTDSGQDSGRSGTRSSSGSRSGHRPTARNASSCLLYTSSFLFCRICVPEGIKKAPTPQLSVCKISTFQCTFRRCV